MIVPEFLCLAGMEPVSMTQVILAGCEALARLRDDREAPVIHLFLGANGEPPEPSPAAPRQPRPKPAPAEAPIPEDERVPEAA